MKILLSRTINAAAATVRTAPTVSEDSHPANGPSSPAMKIPGSPRMGYLPSWDDLPSTGGNDPLEQ